jgi:phage baseplate assembly protein W
MSGYSARLPLSKDSNDGFGLLKTIPEVAKQNFKMLLLTEPGERAWDINYGVGLKKFLFEQRSFVENNLTSKIVNQTRNYLPYINITNMVFLTNDEDNVTNLQITFSISGFNGLIVLEI